MPRNKVQFQKGVSLNDFIKEYGTEEQCFDALYTLRWPEGFKCPSCGHNKCCELSTRKLINVITVTLKPQSQQARFLSPPSYRLPYGFKACI